MLVFQLIHCFYRLFIGNILGFGVFLNGGRLGVKIQYSQNDDFMGFGYFFVLFLPSFFTDNSPIILLLLTDPSCSSHDLQVL